MVWHFHSCNINGCYFKNHWLPFVVNKNRVNFEILHHWTAAEKRILQTYLLIIVSLSRESFQVTTQGSVIRNPVCEPCVLSVRVTVTSADSYVWFCGLGRRKHWSLAAALFTTVDTLYFVSKQIFCLHSSWNLITTLFGFQFSDIPSDLLFKFLIFSFSVFLLPAVCFISLIWFTEFCFCVVKLFGCETMHVGSCVWTHPRTRVLCRWVCVCWPQGKR